MKYYIILSFIIIAYVAEGQDTNPPLITDRPDQTESSSVVPKKSLQIETGFMVQQTETDFTYEKAFSYNTTLLRYGLLDNFELRIGLDYLGDVSRTKSPEITTRFNGSSPLYTGFKVMISEENGPFPEAAFLGGLILPFTANLNYKPDFTAASFRFAFSHSLSEVFSLGYNLGVEWDGSSSQPGYFYSVVLGSGISDKIGIFVEQYALLFSDGNSELMLDGGITYLILPNLQADISGGFGLNENAFDQFISFGLSFRFPN